MNLQEHYQILLRENEAQKIALVENYDLLRTAELMLKQGFPICFDCTPNERKDDE